MAAPYRACAGSARRQALNPSMGAPDVPRGRMTILFVLPFALLLAGARLDAQVTASSIFGTVTDSTGAIVPGVEVKATQQETNFGRTTATDELGRYTFN